MKTILTYILIGAGFMATAQTPNVHPSPQKARNNYPQNSRQHTSPVKTSSRPPASSPRGNSNSPSVQPTPIGRGTSVNRINATRANMGPQSVITNTPNTKNSPFVGGVYAAPNAGRTYDTIVTNGPASNGMVGTVIPGVNDTTFNINTITPEGVTTTSGAVDRSGQSQFGQTNWGRNSRNTVGESQWTIPPPITATFNREFATANNAVWTRNNADTNQYNVRYQTGATWVTSTYDASGTRINMRTEVPLVTPPAPVTVFLARQPTNFKLVSISRLQMQGRQEVYELILANGKTAYIDNNGMEVKL